jgi:hypothetical protein
VFFVKRWGRRIYGGKIEVKRGKECERKRGQRRRSRRRKKEEVE